MVFKIPNAVIEGSIDFICDMPERFGFKMSMAKIAKCPTKVPLPRKSPRINKLPCLFLSPKSPKMLYQRDTCCESSASTDLAA
eukprot:4406786-Prymnesium_polylepis.1